MQNKIKLTPRVEGGILAGVSVLMALAAMLPIIGIAAKILCPLPMIILGIRHGYRVSLLAMVVASILVALMMSPIYSLFLLPGFILVGMTLIYTFTREIGAVKSILYASGASVLAKVIMIAAMFAFMEVNPCGSGVDQVFHDAVDFYRDSGMDESQLVQIEKTMDEMLALTKLLMPGAIIAFSFIEGYLNFAAAGLLLRRLHMQEAPRLLPFKEWRFPKWVVYFYAIALIGIYWSTKYELAALNQAVMNLWILMTMMTLLQGISLLYYATSKYNLSKVVRGFILILVLLHGVFAQMLSIVGLFDILFDYRSRFSKRENK